MRWPEVGRRDAGTYSRGRHPLDDDRHEQHEHAQSRRELLVEGPGVTEGERGEAEAEARQPPVLGHTGLGASQWGRTRSF